MHELSIAYQLVETASQVAQTNGAQRVTAVHLRLGSFAGVVQDALEFGFGIAAAGTPLQGATLQVELIPLTIYCEACRSEVILPSSQSFRCPQCQRPSKQIVRGRELELVSIEIA